MHVSNMHPFFIVRLLPLSSDRAEFSYAAPLIRPFLLGTQVASAD